MKLSLSGILRFSFLILLLAGLTSCEIKPISISKIERTTILDMDKKGIKVQVDVRVKNPNRFGFKVYKSDLQVKVNGRDFGKAKIKNKIKVKANSESLQHIVVESSFENTMVGGLSSIISIAQKNSVNLEVKGDIKAGNFFYKKKFPIEIKENVSLYK